MFFARASLHLFPESQMRAFWEQLRANLHPSTRKSRVPGAPSLRRKEGACSCVFGTTAQLSRRFARLKQNAKVVP
jgi:hypothetical protein